MKNAADQIADRLSDVDELIREVEQRKADKQEIDRLCRAMEDKESPFLLQKRSANEWQIYWMSCILTRNRLATCTRRSSRPYCRLGLSLPASRFP